LQKPKLGEGVYGKVYRAKWLGTTVAVKKMKKLVGEQELSEFKSEVAILSQLRHPNLVLFLGACIEEKRCIVYEYLENGNLYDYLRDNEVKPSEAIRMANDIVCGMNFLHCSQQDPIIHRDLKSLNVLLDRHLNAKIGDFGLAKLKEKGTILNEKVGTIRWTAPEILRGESYTEKVDIYSFAIVLWELFTRPAVVPFEGLTISEVKELVINEKRPELPNCNQRIKALITACWQDQPAKRPTFNDILKELEKIQQEIK